VDRKTLHRSPAPRARAPLRSRAIAAWAVACALTAGCASVLGVDKQYALADSGGDAGVGSGDSAVTTGIRCAPGNPCQPGSEECCFGANHDLSCASTALSDPCPNGTDLVCDDPSDCASGVCCMTVDGQNDVLGTACAASCTNGQKELCAPEGGTCGEGKGCAPLAIQPDPPFAGAWFYGCQ
jgi:hypothetical protein